MTCAELEYLAAELAVGSVSGAERAAALDHLAGCVACRDLVDQLSRVADSLLLLAPVAEPPPHFESEVLSRMGVPAGRRKWLSRSRRLAVAAAVAAVASLSGAGAAWLADGDGRPTELRTALVRDDQNRWTCRAVVYGQDPTWLVVSLDRVDGMSATFTVEALRSDGSSPVPVGTFALQNGHGTLASTVELPAEDLDSVRVLDAGGRVRYEVELPPS